MKIYVVIKNLSKKNMFSYIYIYLSKVYVTNTFEKKKEYFRKKEGNVLNIVIFNYKY